MPRTNHPSYPDLQGQIALVTGIGQVGPRTEVDNWGNGAAITLALARNGAKVFGCDVNLAAGQETKRRVEALVPGAVVDVIATDVTSSTAVEALVAACITAHGRIDILVNNVGRNVRGGPAELSEQAWDDQVAVNLKSVYLTCHSVLPLMEAQGSGAVVNVSSIAGIRYLGKSEVAYSAAKAAVTQFTRHTAVIYADKGVRLNAVLPGLMFTPLVAHIAGDFGASEAEFIAMRHAQVPMGRMGTSMDVANAVIFLSSATAAGFITGQKLIVDGGMVSSTGRT